MSSRTWGFKSPLAHGGPFVRRPGNGLYVSQGTAPEASEEASGAFSYGRDARVEALRARIAMKVRLVEGVWTREDPRGPVFGQAFAGSSCPHCPVAAMVGLGGVAPLWR